MFKKKRPALPPEQRLADCLEKRDYVGLARTYYDMGKAAMEAGDQGRAMLWLSRADTIYSARDDIYEAVGDKLADDSGRVGELEDAPLLSNQMAEQIEKSPRTWETPKYGYRPCSPWPGWSPWGKSWPPSPAAGCWVRWAVAWTWVMKSFQDSITQEKFSFLKTVCGNLYALSDGEAFFAGARRPAGRAPHPSRRST